MEPLEIAGVSIFTDRTHCVIQQTVS